MVSGQPAITCMVRSPVFVVVSVRKELYSHFPIDPAILLMGHVRQHQWLCFLEQETSLKFLELESIIIIYAPAYQAVMRGTSGTSMVVLALTEVEEA